jgi:hypothetical protein
MLVCPSFRCDQIHRCLKCNFGHTLLCYLSLTFFALLQHINCDDYSSVEGVWLFLNFILDKFVTVHLKNVNNCLNTKIYSDLEKSGGQSCKIYLNVVHFFNTSVN